MARIDWKRIKALPAGTVYTLPELDWADPTHIPLMVDLIVEECGNLASELCACSDSPHPCSPTCTVSVLEVTALDALPRGEAAVREAVTAHLYAIAAAEDWTDNLFVFGTEKYPYEESDDS